MGKLRICEQHSDEGNTADGQFSACTNYQIVTNSSFTHSTTISSPTACTLKAEPSFHCKVIGILTFSSICLFKNRAPYFGLYPVSTSISTAASDTSNVLPFSSICLFMLLRYIKLISFTSSRVSGENIIMSSILFRNSGENVFSK